MQASLKEALSYVNHARNAARESQIRRHRKNLRTRRREAESLRDRSATPEILARLGSLPERPATLRKLAGRRLSPTAQAVFGYLRQAARHGYDGAWVGSRELAELLDRSPRMVWYAVDELEVAGLVRRVAQFRYDAATSIQWTPAGPRPLKTYERLCDRNVYALGSKAPRVPLCKGAKGPRAERERRRQACGQPAQRVGKRIAQPQSPHPFGTGGRERSIESGAPLPPSAPDGNQPQLPLVAEWLELSPELAHARGLEGGGRAPRAPLQPAGGGQ